MVLTRAGTTYDAGCQWAILQKGLAVPTAETQDTFRRQGVPAEDMVLLGCYP